MYEYIENFKRLGFGMFIHFGLYSVIGRGEWYYMQYVPEKAEYESTINKFKITEKWAEHLVKTAKDAGCKYITLTIRHHDGFSLYDTRGLSEFDAPHSPTGRDLIREFVDECNKEGIIPFFYHTLLDWHNPDYNNDFPKYIDYLDKSIEILCKNYGKIGGFWFDGMWDKPNEDWQEDRIYSTIRKYQPEAMIINNTGLNALGQTGHREIDSVTFERGKPAFVDTSEKPIAGEVCDALTDHWGYAKYDICLKSPKELIETLVDCRKYDCNLLLNSGLKGNGEMDEGEKAAFKRIGMWIKENKNFIYKAKSTGITAENADLMTDGEYYYAAIKDVPMSANCNVARFGESKTVTLNTDKRIVDAEWLDGGKEIKLKTDNSFVCEPFEYGKSLAVRVAKFKLK